MKEDLEIENIIAEIKNSVKSQNIEDNAWKIEQKGRDSKHERKEEIRGNLQEVQNKINKSFRKKKMQGRKLYKNDIE